MSETKSSETRKFSKVNLEGKHRKKVVAIVQARMGASRLPGKVLLPIGNKLLLDLVCERLSRVSEIDEIVIATTHHKRDDAIVEFCKSRRLKCFRGEEEDVLDRYYHCAFSYRADVIVRITADCPLIDPKIVSRVILKFLNGIYDYVSNTLIFSFPDGLDVEVFSFQALEDAWRNATQPIEREHVTPYLKNNERFRQANVQHDKDLSRLRWTVDELCDIEFIRKVYEHAESDSSVGMEDILKIVEAHSEIAANQHLAANEGYYHSFIKEPLIPARPLVLDLSHSWKKRAEAVIPSCTQTFSKGFTQFSDGVSPVFAKSADGCMITDVDGNQFIDYGMALGPIVLGYNNSAVNRAVTAQLQQGVVFTLPHFLETELAEQLVSLIPCAEMVRFGKNGSDATSGAVRIARAYTKKDVVACCGYHGWQDWYIGSTTRNLGVPDAVRNLTAPFRYNNIESLEKIFSKHQGRVACVIMEPVGIEEPQNGFLEAVKELAHRHGALLIFDEVITGFRFALGGAQSYFGVTPDLACFGKALGNGFPISAIVGRREIMELFDEIFYSFTFGGECISIAAALATLQELSGKNVIPHLWSQGKKLKEGYNKLAEVYGIDKYTKCVGFYPRTVMSFYDSEGGESYLLKSVIQQECLRRGLLFTGYQFISLAHTNQIIDDSLRIFRSVFEVLHTAIKENALGELLEGKAIQPVFRKA